MNFPVLSQKPIKIDRDSVDQSIRNKTEGGYDVRRNRNTRELKMFTVTYQILDDSDKIALLNFENSVKTTVPFSWQDHQEQKTYNVYLDEKLKYFMFAPGWWQFQPIKLVEV